MFLHKTTIIPLFTYITFDFKIILDSYDDICNCQTLYTLFILVMLKCE